MAQRKQVLGLASRAANQPSVETPPRKSFALPPQLPLQPPYDRIPDLVLRHAGGAAHMGALRIDARLLRRAVLHEQIDVVDRRLVVELAVDAEDRRRGLVEQA